MRVGDLDRSADPWTLRPRRHKNRHRGHARVILVGPRAQEVLRPLLGDDLDAFVFRPGAAKDRRYERNALRTAIRRACKKAGVPHWHPHQLRHAAADRFAGAAGMAAA